MLRSVSRRQAVVGVVATIALIATTAQVVTLAQGPETSELTACVSRSGFMRLVDADDSCRKREERVTWNIEGPAGPVGAAGAAGADGEPGTDGAPGVAGPAGPAGATGPAGPTGKDGATGPEGPAGPKGDTGDSGKTGETGPAGAKGDKGDTGDPGAAGPSGQTGPAGPAGPTGPAGPAGPGGDPTPTNLTFGFLTIPGIAGSSTDQHHRDTFDTFDFSVAFSNSQSASGGIGVGNVSKTDLIVTLDDSPGIVQLIDAANNGRRIPDATLDVCDGYVDGKAFCPLKIELRDVSVSAVNYHCGECNGVPLMADVALSYEVLTLTAIEQRADGSTTNSTYGFDFENLTRITSPPTVTGDPTGGPLLLDLGGVTDQKALSFAHGVSNNGAAVGGGGAGVGAVAHSDFQIIAPTGPSTLTFLDTVATARVVPFELEATTPGCSGQCPTKIIGSPAAGLTSLSFNGTEANITVAYRSIDWEFNDGTRRQDATWDLR